MTSKKEPVEGEKKETFISKLKTRIKNSVTNSNTKICVGILLLVLCLYVTVAYVNFFFTSSTDASLIETGISPTQDAEDGALNASGFSGAVIADFMVNKTFGVSSFCIIIVLWCIGMKILTSFKLKIGRIVGNSLFWMLWISLLLGLVCTPFSDKSSIYWGGLHGQSAATLLNTYIGVFGTTLVLITTLAMFLTLMYPELVEKVKNYFVKKDEPSTVDGEEKTDDNKANSENSESTTPSSEANPSESESDESKAENTEVKTDDKDVKEEAIEVKTPDNIGIEKEQVATPVEKAEEKTDDNTDGGFKVKINDDDDDLPFNHEPNAVQNATSSNEQPEPPAEQEMPVSIFEEENSVQLEPINPRLELPHYKFPPIELLKEYPNNKIEANEEELNDNQQRITTALRTYGVEVTSIEAQLGPTVTLYEITLAPGIRISKVQSLNKDIAMSLKAEGVRIIAPIPGKGTIGIEVPNQKKLIVPMHDMVASKKYQTNTMELPIILGKTITNNNYMIDLAKCPHVICAGATGQGKSVALNAVLMSLLYKKHPSELKLVLVDPKTVEFSMYAPLLKHYLAKMPGEDDAIITDVTKVVAAMNSLCVEMENRYELLKKAKVRNIIEYNDKYKERRLNPENGHHFLPYIVVIIDEFADLIMQVGKDIETPVARLAQKARAIGIHVILATQRPSVNVITGLIKSNFPVRFACKTAQAIDSKTILDCTGAETLIGRGDMLILSNGNLERVQCAFVDTPEVEAINDYIQAQEGYLEPYELPEYVDPNVESAEDKGIDLRNRDPFFEEAARLIVGSGQGSTSMLQRKFSLGYNRSGRLMDQLEVAGIVGPQVGSKPREVYINDLDTLEMVLQNINSNNPR